MITQKHYKILNGAVYCSYCGKEIKDFIDEICVCDGERIFIVPECKCIKNEKV